MNENDEMSVRERLDKVEAERKELKATLAKEKKEKLENAAANRKTRDDEIKKTSGIISEIQKEIYTYNKSGKVDKGKSNVLNNIIESINNPNKTEETNEDTSSY